MAVNLGHLSDTERARGVLLYVSPRIPIFRNVS